MGIWLLLTVSVLVLAEPSCNNPLFSAANWPSDLQRPRYLSTPQAITNSTFCSKFQSDATETCCDKDTIADIVQMFNARKGKMKEKGEGLQGGVKDTFNDFDPANQKAKGVQVPTGGKRQLQATSSGQQTPPAGQTTPPQGGQQAGQGQPQSGTGAQTGPQGGQTGTQGGQTGTQTGPQGGQTGTQGGQTGTQTGTQGGQTGAQPQSGTPPQGQSNTTSQGTPRGPPPKEDRPPGFNDVDVPDKNLTAPTPPQGRGTEKKRPGLLKMSQTAQDSISNITRDMSALMQQFAHSMGKCMMAQLKHMAGMMCMGCDPSWESWVSDSSGSITVTLKDTACDGLVDACLDFVKQAQNLPTLIEQMKASVQAVIDSEIAAGTITAADVPTGDLDSRTKPPAQVTAVCSTDADCRTYICNTMSKGKAGVAPEPSTVADPASVSSSGRLLAASVTYVYSSSGYDSVSLGATATSSTTATSTGGTFIDGVSTETAPLDTSSAEAILALFGLIVIH